MFLIDYFSRLTQIPHCSYEAWQLRDFLVDFGRERGYRAEVDTANNILIYKGKPQLCLQAHYDMVCMGKAPKIETYIEEGWLKAREASLGADNGIAIAMMMALMDEGQELEFLFTADEEVGLVGANALAFPLYSHSMLNLDFEEEAEVCIGCAGGADIIASRTDTLIEGRGQCYEVAVKGLAGGHSGVDIDKDIPSAIKILGAYLATHGVTQVASLYGGERANSIPANAVAIVRSEKSLESKGEIEVCLLQESPMVYADSKTLIALIDRFEHGVRSFNEALGIPQSSINLAIITADERGSITIETSARAMDMETLQGLTDETIAYFTGFGYNTETKDKYPAWKPVTNAFTHIVDTQMAAVFGKSKTVAIHAGLECGVILKQYPDIKFASIGPTICYPHSTREMVNIQSVEDTYKVLKKIVTALTVD